MKTKNPLLVFNGIRMSKEQIFASIKSIEANLSKGGGVKDKKSAYYQSLREKVEAGRKLLGAVYIKEAEKNFNIKSSNKKLLVKEHPHLAAPPKVEQKSATKSPKSVIKSHKSAKTKASTLQTEDVKLEYKKEACKLYESGKHKPLDAILIAAKKFKQLVTAGMKRYPHSFLHNYRKAIA